MTATPDKANQSLLIDDSASRGEREAKAALLIKYNTPVRHVDFTQIDEFLNNLYDQYPRSEKLRVLIDIGGRLKGENKEIAQAFARLLQRKGSPVQYVIYYDETDELHAVSTRTNKIVGLGSSTDPDVLSKKLHGCPVEEMALVLDESHTEGANHVLATDCDGAAIINLDTTFDKMMQGIMRLRDLPEGQRVTIILPSGLGTLTSIQDVLKYTKELAQASLPTRMLSTATGETLSIIRRDLLTQALLLPNITAQHEFLRQPGVQSFFIRSRNEYSVETGDTNNDHAVEIDDASDVSRGAVVPSNRSAARLRAHAQQALAKWQTVRGDDTSRVEEQVAAVLERPMLEIDDDTSELFGGTLETQTQTQIQVVPPGSWCAV